MKNEIAKGSKFNGICCKDYDWEAIIKVNNWWGICHNPDCPIEAGTHYHGVSSLDEADIEMRLENAKVY